MRMHKHIFWKNCFDFESSSNASCFQVNIDIFISYEIDGFLGTQTPLVLLLRKLIGVWRSLRTTKASLVKVKKMFPTEKTETSRSDSALPTLNQTYLTNSKVKRFQFVICLVPDRSVLILSSKTFFAFTNDVLERKRFLSQCQNLWKISFCRLLIAHFVHAFSRFLRLGVSDGLIFSFCRFFNSWRFELVF
jgi:hypothetical protein